MIVPYTTLGEEDGCEELCEEIEGGNGCVAKEIVCKDEAEEEDFERL